MRFAGRGGRGITLPALAWERLLDALDLEARAALLEQVKKPAAAISKSAVKAAIEGGQTVPGADLLVGKKTLVRR